MVAPNTRRAVSFVVGAVGVALLIVSAFADSLDIGKHGFGWKQTTGIIVGAVLIVAAAGIAFAARGSRAS